MKNPKGGTARKDASFWKSSPGRVMLVKIEVTFFISFRFDPVPSGVEQLQRHKYS